MEMLKFWEEGWEISFICNLDDENEEWSYYVVWVMYLMINISVNFFILFC